MSDVLNLLCDYAAAGAVVDRSLIAKVESEIARLYAAAGASEIARLTERLAAAEALLRTASVSELVKRAVKEAANERQ